MARSTRTESTDPGSRSMYSADGLHRARVVAGEVNVEPRVPQVSRAPHTSQEPL